MAETKLYEQVMLAATIPQQLKQALQGIPVISIDSVAKHYLDVATTEGWHLVSDIPNAVPPFKRFFLEYERANGLQVGFLITMHEDEFKAPSGTNPEAIQEIEKFYKNGAKWVYDIAIFMKAPDSPSPLYVYILFFAVDKTGQVVYIPDANGGCGTITLGSPTKYAELASKVAVFSKDEQSNLLIAWAIRSSFIAILGVSFLHAKGSRLATKGTIRPNAKRNRHKALSGMNRWYSLDINEIYNKISRDGRKAEVGDRKALQNCAALFNEFDGGRLLGRVKETVWEQTHSHSQCMKAGCITTTLL